MTLSRELGVEPMDEVKKLFKYERSGEAVPLNIGSHAYGRYRWSILSHDTKIDHTDRNGDIHTCTVTVKMQEYLNK